MPGHRAFLSLRIHRNFVLLTKFFFGSRHSVFFFVPRDQLTVLFARMEHLHKTTATRFFFVKTDGDDTRVPDAVPPES